MLPENWHWSVQRKPQPSPQLPFLKRVKCRSLYHTRGAGTTKRRPALRLRLVGPESGPFRSSPGVWPHHKPGSIINGPVNGTLVPVLSQPRRFGNLSILAASLRCVELGKGGSHVGYIVKPFDGTLRVSKPVRKSLANSRKRVLRLVGCPPPWASCSCFLPSTSRRTSTR